VRLVEPQVGFGQFQVQQILSAGQVQRPGFREDALPLFEQVGDVLPAEGLELQGILDGPGGGVRPVDLGQGDDLANVMQDVEPPLSETLVESLGLGRQRQQPLQQLLVTSATTLQKQGLGVIGILEVAPAVVAAHMPGDQPVLVVQAQLVGVELERQSGPGVFRGHRVGVGVHGHAELTAGPDRPEDADIVRSGW